MSRSKERWGAPSVGLPGGGVGVPGRRCGGLRGLAAGSSTSLSHWDLSSLQAMISG